MSSARLNSTTKRLIGLRLARSFGQGALVVDLALYLKALGWSGAAIGGVLGATGIAAATLSLAVGILSDRLGRKPFLVAAEGLTILCAALALFTANPWILTPAIAFGGFGRGMNGAPSFFGPAEQAWLAQTLEPHERGRVYSLNMAVGAFGMAAGAGLAALPAVVAPAIGLTTAFRLLFLIPIAGALVNLVSLGWLPEARPARVPAASSGSSRARQEVRRQENRLLAMLAGLNVTNGLAVGLIAPLLSYWFALRFGIGAAAIAPFIAVTFVTGGIAALLTGRLSERIGVVPAVVSVRTLSALLLALVPVMPIYALAAAIFALRSALNRGSGGARQALVVSLVSDARRGLAVSLNTASFQYAQGIGPAIAGVLLDAGAMMAPFFAAAGLQLLYVIGYWFAFRRHDPSREEVAVS